MPTSPTTTEAHKTGFFIPLPPPSRRAAFTLIEIMIVVAIFGLMAAVLVPRISFYYEPPSALLQRSVEEATNLSLSGVSLRFVLKSGREENSTGGGRRGAIITEALIKKEPDSHDLSVFLGTAKKNEGVLVWTPVAMTYPPAGNGWKMEPEIVYFYTDGSCTPARISWAGPGISDSDADEFLLTVTGYCAPVPKL